MKSVIGSEISEAVWDKIWVEVVDIRTGVEASMEYAGRETEIISVGNPSTSMNPRIFPLIISGILKKLGIGN